MCGTVEIVRISSHAFPIAQTRFAQLAQNSSRTSWWELNKLESDRLVGYEWERLSMLSIAV